MKTVNGLFANSTPFAGRHVLFDKLLALNRQWSEHQ